MKEHLAERHLFMGTSTAPAYFLRMQRQNGCTQVWVHVALECPFPGFSSALLEGSLPCFMTTLPFISKKASRDHFLSSLINVPIIFLIDAQSAFSLQRHSVGKHFNELLKKMCFVFFCTICKVDCLITIQVRPQRFRELTYTNPLWVQGQNSELGHNLSLTRKSGSKHQQCPDGSEGHCVSHTSQWSRSVTGLTASLRKARCNEDLLQKSIHQYMSNASILEGYTFHIL